MSVEDRKMDLKKSYWPQISSPAEASGALDDAIKAFFVLAAIQAAAGLYLSGGVSGLIEPALVAALAFWLKKSNSRGPAVGLAVWALMVVCSTIENRFSGGTGGTNIFLSVIVACIAITSVRATWFLSQHKPTPPAEDQQRPAA